jgi:ribosomal protein L37E
MNHVFCTQCGHKIEYNHSKPNFCSKCGSPTDSVSQASVPIKIRRNEISDENLKDDETSVDELPDISELKVDIQAEGKNNTFTFGSLFGENDEPKQSRRRSKDVNDFIDEKKRR